MSILSPYLKSPFTDLAAVMISNQWGCSACADIEMKALDCLEAYGLDKGLKKCDILIKDFEECVYKTKEVQRANAMRVERHRQHLAGERTKEDKYTKSPPSPDSY